MSVVWPTKTRELQNHHLDSTFWNDFPFRDDDIVIATYAKSGTTWLQQIVAQLIFEGAENLELLMLSPWLDTRVQDLPTKMRILDAQRHRRFVKTHLPVDALNFSPRAKYLYIARDARDVVWSLYNHHSQANDAYYKLINESPGLVGPPLQPVDLPVHEYFLRWLRQDGFPFWSYWDNVRSWWGIRHLPNVLVLHYAQLKADLPREVRRIADFLGISIKPECWERIIDHCGFEYMKTHASTIAWVLEPILAGGADSFINKGTNGRWSDVLTGQDNRLYESIARAELGDDCAHWLMTGQAQALADA